MYHYVRDLAHSRFPAIKGLDIGEFRAQLAYLRRHYEFVRVEDVLAALEGEPLPENALLLTFDDAYADHYRYVFPILDELGVQGAFYPSARSVVERKVLTVNKIHMILASAKGVDKLMRDVFALLDAHRDAHALRSNESYVAELAQANRFDRAEVVFIKRLLQRALPAGARDSISNTLLERYVGADEATLHEELYASADQLKLMLRCGMHVGLHGFDHHWLTHLSEDALAQDLDAALVVLGDLGVDTARWTMAYPFGSYDETVIRAVRDKGCCLAFTTEPERAQVTPAQRYRIARFDTNDFPKVEVDENEEVHGEVNLSV